jgi:DNA-binding MarR family transcriptional regulator
MTLPTKPLKLKDFAGISPAGKLIWKHLLEHGEGEHGVRVLADELGLSVRAVHNALADLRAAGLVTVTVPTSGRRPARLRAEVPI